MGEPLRKAYRESGPHPSRLKFRKDDVNLRRTKLFLAVNIVTGILLSAGSAFAASKGEPFLYASIGSAYSDLNETFSNGEYVSLASQFNLLGAFGIGSRFGQNKEGFFLLQGRVDRRTYSPPSGFIVNSNQKTLIDIRAASSVSSNYFKAGGSVAYSREPYLVETTSSVVDVQTMNIPSVTANLGYYLFNTKKVSADIGMQGTYYLKPSGISLKSGNAFGGVFEVQWGTGTTWNIQGAFLKKTFSLSNGEPKSTQFSVQLGMMVPF